MTKLPFLIIKNILLYSLKNFFFNCVRNDVLKLFIFFYLQKIIFIIPLIYCYRKKFLFLLTVTKRQLFLQEAGPKIRIFFLQNIIKSLKKCYFLFEESCVSLISLYGIGLTTNSFFVIEKSLLLLRWDRRGVWQNQIRKNFFLLFWLKI